VLQAQITGRAHGTRPRRADPGSPRPDGNALLALQGLAGNANVVRALSSVGGVRRSPVLDVVRSGRGSPLAASVRALMERRLGHDLSSVRVHTDDAAGESARALNATAYTVGENIVFQGHAYRPQTRAGRRMLAHELVHVVQQRLGPVSGVPAPGGIKLSEPSDAFEREADRLADEVALPSDARDGDEADRPLVVGRPGQISEEGR
jgi:hypothetical protein